MPQPFEDVTEDRLLGGRICLTQPAEGFRAGLDAIFLAAAVTAKAGDRVLEVGSGSGAASLCLAARVERVSVIGLDSDRALVRLASENAETNRLAGRVQFFSGDLLAPPMRLAPASFDHVMANPPFRPAGQGRLPQHSGRAAAMVEDEAKLEDWVKFCLSMLRPSGILTLIYTPERLDTLLNAVVGRLGGVSVFPLWPGTGSARAAKRILVSGRRSSQAPLALLPGLVLHDSDGSYTAEADAILRDATAINW